MSYMTILKYGRERERSMCVFGSTLQVCGQRLHDRLLSWPGDEHWPVVSDTCRLFRLEKIGPAMERRLEIQGPEKKSALRELRSGINNG
ncbi:hypothetical protein [Aquipseudomonas alcaligenes]|uniref:Uncharacterized protein n=1 Tax=Aquipseudomonas alcaligenes TaxID=43263 RepID=A0A1N6XDE5_AQUAC|nr:hypothetical protein [Pseudomonas alcaligenes]SIR00372.1 hypothetical protein SAMN05878282_11296 [Pseudomonas alcaligenes]